MLRYVVRASLDDSQLIRFLGGIWDRSCAHLTGAPHQQDTAHFQQDKQIHGGISGHHGQLWNRNLPRS